MKDLREVILGKFNKNFSWEFGYYDNVYEWDIAHKVHKILLNNHQARFWDQPNNLFHDLIVGALPDKVEEMLKGKKGSWR